MIRSLSIHLLCLALCASLSARRFDRDGHFDLWVYAALNKKICEKAKLTFEPEFRFRDGGSTLYLYYFQSRLHFELNRGIDLAPGYRQIYVRRTRKRNWQPVYSPLLDIIFKRKVNSFRFELRNRMQYLFFDQGSTRWRYRQRYRLTGHLCLWGIDLEPTVHNEFFFRQRAGFDENRFGVGLGIPQFGLKVEYLFNEVKRDPEWHLVNVLYLSTYFTF